MSAAGSNPAPSAVPDRELRLETALLTAGVASWELDVESGRFDADAELAEVCGLAADGGLDRLPDLLRLVHPDDRDRIEELLTYSVGGPDAGAEEFRVVRPDGDQRWLLLQARPVSGPEGRARLVGSVVETTARHDAAHRAAEAGVLTDLVSSASALLAGSLEPNDAVRAFARLVVPALADWSVVSLVGEDGRLVDVDWWHHDPTKRALTGLFAAHRLDGTEADEGTLGALASGEPFVLNGGVARYAEEQLRSEVARRAVQRLQIECAAVLPMVIDGRVVGTISLARGATRGPFTPEELATALDLTRRVGVTLANARSYVRERDMSEQLQRSMLTKPFHADGLEVTSRYLPAVRAAQIGGDWYDAFVLPDGATMLVVGDVVGHDSVAASAMGQVRSMLRGVAAVNQSPPARLLGEIDRVLVQLRLWTNATVVVGSVAPGDDGDTRVLRWSNAGHPSPVLVDPDGRARLLTPHDMLIGLAPEAPRTEHEVTLAPGSTLLLYTDGLVERRGEDIDRSLERLREAACHLGGRTLDQAVDQLLVDLLPDEPYDDVVVLAMRVRS